MAAALERRIVSGDGVTLPDAERGIARVAGTADLAAGDWPDAFLVRAGETVCVAVSPFTGCYEFFDESGERVTGDVRRNWCPDDWCGEDERGFYPDADSLPQKDLIERLVMCGLQNGNQRDFSCGSLHGIRRTWVTTTSFELTNAVPVGVFPGTIPPFPHHH